MRNIDELTSSAQNTVIKMRQMPTLGTYNYTEKDGSFYRVIGSSDNEPKGAVEYKLNSDLYRSIEFSEKPPILALGCSITYGTGIPYEATWPQILGSLMGLKVGTIGLPGTGAEKIIDTAFKVMEKYDYKPEYIFALFPNFERLRVYCNSARVMNDNSITFENFKVHYNSEKDTIGSIIPLEYAFWKTISWISILDSFCKKSGIKFVWTTWAEHYQKEELAILDSFMYDKTQQEFPSYGYGPIWTPDYNVRKSYYQYPEMKCHPKEEKMHEDYFYYAYDNRTPRFHSGFYRFGPHPGMHRNIHWAEHFYSHINKVI